MIAKLIGYYHAILTIGIIVIPYIVSKYYIPYYLSFVCIMMLQWYILKGKCVLTLLEDYFEDKTIVAEKQNSSFVINFIDQKCGISMRNKKNKKRVSMFLNTLFYFSFLFGFYRIAALQRGAMALSCWFVLNGKYSLDWD